MFFSYILSGPTQHSCSFKFDPQWQKISWTFQECARTIWVWCQGGCTIENQEMALLLPEWTLCLGGFRLAPSSGWYTSGYCPLSRILRVKSESGCFTLFPVEHPCFLSWKRILLSDTWVPGSWFGNQSHQKCIVGLQSGRYNRPASSGLLRLRAVLERGEEG